MIALLVAVALRYGHGSVLDDDRPPRRFQGNVTVTATLTDRRGILRACLPDPQPATLDGCEDGKHIFVPNPCLPQFKGQDYAEQLCHELGHANGWPDNHPR